MMLSYGILIFNHSLFNLANPLIIQCWILTLIICRASQHGCMVFCGAQIRKHIGNEAGLSRQTRASMRERHRLNAHSRGQRNSKQALRETLRIIFSWIFIWFIKYEIKFSRFWQQKILNLILNFIIRLDTWHSLCNHNSRVSRWNRGQWGKPWRRLSRKQCQNNRIE